EPFGRVDGVDAGDAHHRTLALKPDARQDQPHHSAVLANEKLGAGLKALLGKIGLQIDDDLTADAVRASDASDHGHLFPVGCVRTCRNHYGAPGRPSRISSATVLPSCSPAVDASVRSAAAVRPWRPMTLPRSPGPT